jgi:hypothetical protein
MPEKGYKSKNSIKNLFYSMMLVQRSSVEDSLIHSDYSLFGEQVGSALSLKDCKNDIINSYKNTESKMPEIIKSIREKSKSLNI